MRTTVLAERIRNGKVIEIKEIGNAILDEGRISARKYNELKKKALIGIAPRRKGEYVRIVTENGLKDTFGGYPADTYVKFE